MKRRTLLQAALAAPALAGLPRFAIAQQLPFDPQPAKWRTFELTSRVELANPKGVTTVWIPLPSVESDYQDVLGNEWKGNAVRMMVVADGNSGAKMLRAEWGTDEGKPWVEVTSRVKTQNRKFDLAANTNAKLPAEERAYYTAATASLPTDGLVRKTALEATKGAKTELEKAKAIYEWIVDNTFRDPKTVGCGRGDVKVMLETGNLGGKCADLNALYVAMARSVGLPARDVYGLRVVKSEFGYRSLGAGSEVVTRAQHCRAEVFVTGRGWIPVDPADVRKVVLEEKPQPTNLADPIVPPVRAKLFGAWEMNWLAYNDAHDVKLPGSSGAALPFLMYPQAETGGQLVNPYAPDDFKYKLTAREIT
ncbi:transglutaminase [Betaproteobacteria bacterium GR16-43]|nr:transglutaminase [Betaproteobacteria bacterium GR16-43]